MNLSSLWGTRRFHSLWNWLEFVYIRLYIHERETDMSFFMELYSSIVGPIEDS